MDGLNLNLNYKKDVKIDSENLELEWLDQPELAVSYGKEWSVIKRIVAILDEKVKVIRSELIIKAWDNPNKYLGQPKGAVQTVEAFYRNHKKHKEAKQKLIEAQEVLDLTEIVKNEISFTRKAALENMVKLYISDYFAGPNVPRDLKEVKMNRDQERSEANKKNTKVKREDLGKDKKKKKKKKSKV